jgi:hypothetical protein
MGDGMSDFVEHFAAPESASNLATRFAGGNGLSGTRWFALRSWPRNDDGLTDEIQPFASAAIKILLEPDPEDPNKMNPDGTFEWAGGDGDAMQILQKQCAGWLFSSALTVDQGGPAYLNLNHSPKRHNTLSASIFCGVRVPLDLFVRIDSDMRLHALVNGGAILKTEKNGAEKHLAGNAWFGKAVDTVSVVQPHVWKQFVDKVKTFKGVGSPEPLGFS